MMRTIQKAVQQNLLSLSNLLEKLDDTGYCKQSSMLSNVSIGQHVRHIVGLMDCLLYGYKNGLVNYDNRRRDKTIETNRLICSQKIKEIALALELPDKEIILEGAYLPDEPIQIQIKSTYNRELVYNLEHAVHHMALIKVALKEFDKELVDSNFGVANATIEYRNACVQ